MIFDLCLRGFLQYFLNIYLQEQVGLQQSNFSQFQVKSLILNNNGFNPIQQYQHMKKNTEAIIAVGSAFLVLLVFGSIYTFGALTPYISSYLYYQGDPTKNTSLSILFTLTLILINIGVVVSTMFLSNISNRILTIAAVIGMSSAVFVASFMTKFIGFVIFYGLVYGFFIGIGYFPPVKNAYLHLPKKKGICSGICMSGFGLGSALFNIIILQLVNPHNAEADKATGRYPQQIAQNVPFTLKVLAAVYLCLGLIGSILIRPPSNKANRAQRDESLLASAEVQQENIQKKQMKIKELFKFFIEKKAHFVIIQIACIAPFGMFMAFNYKRMALERNDDFKKDDRLITLIGSIGILCNGLFRLGWGYLFDHISYKKIVTTINICLLSFCGVILFAVKNPVTYCLIIPCIYLSYGGLYAITPTQSVRILGKQVGAKLFWLIFSGFSLSAVIQFTVQYFFLTQPGNGYYYCIGTFGLLQIIGLVVCITTKFENVTQQNHLQNKQKKDQSSTSTVQ